MAGNGEMVSPGKPWISCLNKNDYIWRGHIFMQYENLQIDIGFSSNPRDRAVAVRMLRQEAGEPGIPGRTDIRDSHRQHDDTQKYPQI